MVSAISVASSRRATSIISSASAMSRPTSSPGYPAQYLRSCKKQARYKLFPFQLSNFYYCYKLIFKCINIHCCKNRKFCCVYEVCQHLGAFVEFMVADRHGIESDQVIKVDFGASFILCKIERPLDGISGMQNQ